MEPLDPRLAAVDKRLQGVRRIVAITGGKGGIGKSSVASVLALVLAEAGTRTGLLDLDLTAPSDHVILGLGDAFTSEEFGVDPPLVHGIAFMSLSYFLRDHVASLRGEHVTNALLELLAITRWAERDLLVIDMPPGLGDVALDTVRWLPRAEYLVVAGASPVVIETVHRTLRLLRELSVPITGVVENMARESVPTVAELARRFDVPFLGSLPFDPQLDAAQGDAERLGRTDFAQAVRGLRDGLLANGGPGSEGTSPGA